MEEYRARGSHLTAPTRRAGWAGAAVAVALAGAGISMGATELVLWTFALSLVPLCWLLLRRTADLRRALRALDRETAGRRAAERRFHAIMEQSTTGALLLDDEGRVLYANPQVATMLGHSVEAICALPHFLDLVVPDDRSPEAGRFQARLRGEAIHTEPTRLLRADGSPLRVRAVGGPVALEGDLVVALSLTDLSDVDDARDRLVRSEAYFREIIEHSTDVLVALSPEGRVRYASPAIRRVFGATAEDVVGKYALRFVHREDAERATDLIGGDGGYGRRTQLRVSHGSGTWVETDAVASALRDPKDREVVVVSLRDVTEERRRARAVERSESRFRSIFKDSPIAHFALSGGGRILDCNQAAATVCGLPCADLIGRYASDLMANESSKDLLEGMVATREERGGGAMSLMVQRPGGERREVECVATALGGGANEVLLIGRDVTEERRREERLRRAEGFASVGSMLGSVSHELNNPLQAILGLSEILLAEEDGNPYLRQVRQEAERAKSLVADLLRDLRTAAEGRQMPRLLDVNEVVRAVGDRSHWRVGPAGIRLELDLSDGLPAVLGSADEISAALDNLVANACQAMATTTTGEKVLTLRTEPVDGGVDVAVVDTGPGIATDDLDRIFDPHFTTKPQGEGTGLGLVLVRRTAREHGGAVSVHSTVGGGSRFTLWLPPCEVPGDSVPDSAGSMEHGAGSAEHALRILLADDELGVRMGFGQFLRLRGHEVVEALDGSGLLELLGAQAPFDLVVTDLCMPGLPPEDLLDRLARYHPEYNDRLLVMTGGAGSVEILDLLMNAGRPHLFKPFSPRRAARLVETMAQAQGAGLAADGP